MCGEGGCVLAEGGGGWALEERLGCSDQTGEGEGTLKGMYPEINSNTSYLNEFK